MPVKIEDQFTVAGQVAVITGGTGVLGSAMARGLAANGVKVAVLGRSAEKGAAVVAAVETEGGEALFVQTDVTDRSSCEAAAAKVVAQWGRIDILVNAAGGNNPKATATPELPFFELPAEALKQVMDLNIIGTMVPTQVFGKVIAESGSGTVVNISSMAAMKPLTKVVGYAASKAAVDNFTHWMSTYMCQHVGPGVRVNAIAPGFFLTEQNRFLLTDKATGALTARGQSIIDHTPMGRFGEPDELVGTLLWLVSPAAKFVTGVVVPVDGGFSAFGGI